ncbi:hypothetical protein E0Z10_g5722 [Xylaria hypoxylon]|uniref:Uncharacterized protein n=1 Tax=Xylaria hypoxylon TaxID=37992 RepID=A0A4Z0YX90_9PEZI|nr:hypothetical protein E0Z10_g5722 [Xylaria hypoxylon]
MQPEKHLATAGSNSVDNESIDTNQRPGRPSTTRSAGPSDMRRRSQSSLRSESSARTPISCVSRESMSGDDCARQRFIHLSTGEYVCYECMKVERFNDKKCTCCFKQPTKRRRIINIAKHFFSNIGSAKARRENTSLPTSNAQYPPPSYDSLVVDIHEQYSQAPMEDPALQGESARESEQLGPRQPQLELNGTELLELDSTPLFPTAELDAVNYDAHPTASGRDITLASPITPLSANAHPMTLQENRAFSTEKDMDILTCPEDPCHYALGDVPELPGDNQLSSAIPRLLSDPFMFSYDPKDNYSWLSSMNTDISRSTSVNMMFTDPNVKTGIPREFLGSQITGSEAKALVEQVWDALGEHFSNSVSKLIMHEDSLITRSNKLYEQAIAYGAIFDATHRDNYYQIVTAIWQQNSQESTSPGRFRDSTNRPTGGKGKEPDYHTSSIAVANSDPLVVTGQNFLDELENIMINGNIQQPIQVLSSELWSSHITANQSNLQVPTALTIASQFLVQDLCRRYHDSENLLSKLKAILQNARGGYYSTIRKLELELIQTGKNYFTSNDFSDQYIIHVRDLCDQIYSQSGTRSRTEYHLLGISLVDSLIRSVAREPQQPQQEHSEYPIIPYSYNDEFLRDLKTFEWGYPILPSSQQPQGVEDFSSSLVMGGLHSATSDTSHLPITSDASETPSDSYTVSPAPLSDAPPELQPSNSNSYRPTPPSQAQGEGSETSGPSTLASSGQKVEANERCEICGYRPKGDPQWFKGSMAKHKKMQHSTNPPVIYKCPFPGCSSEYKNRRDNLRQHQIEKNHFVGDEQRPSKRKRREHA